MWGQLGALHCFTAQFTNVHTLIRLLEHKGDTRGLCRECGVQGRSVGEPALAGGDPAGGDQQHPVGGGDHAMPHLWHEGHDCPLH